ncbi:hypothetical protein NDU88_003929 [Pleurodeles waltl]|uniref:Uncharacterized protein n=1 Tax=Pleurodeles waltl TaxID=8319 RepID=A0AAV7KZG0_PLEWA|nr:hypothetical protein NDU88_003929 [Pleurodeles waltl]
MERRRRSQDDGQWCKGTPQTERIQGKGPRLPSEAEGDTQQISKKSRLTKEENGQTSYVTEGDLSMDSDNAHLLVKETALLK